jgi:hypothetical protein
VFRTFLPVPRWDREYLSSFSVDLQVGTAKGMFRPTVEGSSGFEVAERPTSWGGIFTKSKRLYHFITFSSSSNLRLQNLTGYCNKLHKLLNTAIGDYSEVAVLQHFRISWNIVTELDKKCFLPDWHCWSKSIIAKQASNCRLRNGSEVYNSCLHM